MDNRPVGLRPGVVGTTLRYAALTVAALVFLLPFYLIVRNGLSTEAEITSPEWSLFPRSLHWENVTELFTDPSVPMAHALWNSLVIALLQTVGQLLLGSLDQSPSSRLRIPSSAPTVLDR